MNNLNNLYLEPIQDLFILPFDEIIKKYNNSAFSWKNFEKIFYNLYKSLIETKNEHELIYNYYIFTILYLNYTNYLQYSSNPDFNDKNIYKLIDKVKYNKNILSKIINYSSNPTVNNIIKTSNPFVSLKSKKHKFATKEYLDKFIKEYLINMKQMEKIAEMDNNNFKKSLNIIIFRNIICKKNNYINYSDFFIKNIINKNNLNILLDFDTFIKNLPNYRKILDIKTKNTDFNCNFTLKNIIHFFINKFPKIDIEIDKENFILSSKKYGGKLIIKIDNSISTIQFNPYQLNYSLLYHGLQELKNFNFLKKTSNFIEIKLCSNNIKEYSSLLDIIHLITISIKMLETYPNDLNECIYPIDYTNYYFMSFCNFFEFVKHEIKTSPKVNKFIIDLFKYYYIYSHYDFYYYHSNNLIDTLMSSYNHKNDIYVDFVNNLKNLLKIPKELLSYPPFFDIEDDINSLIYYSFEIPSYFKLFDLINAVCWVFDKNYYSSNKNNKIFCLEEIICKYFITQQQPIQTTQTNKPNNKSNQKQMISSSDSNSESELINTQISEKPKSKSNLKYNNKNKKVNFNEKQMHMSKSNTSSYNSSKSENNSNSIDYNSNSESDSLSEDDLKSRLTNDQISHLSKKNKKLMHNTNTYVELNIENSLNYGLDTDK